ncbi:MAG: asparaginase [Rubellimicrobium sp.]|nr:asparaginase [Rubellimicrobium sp.]
MTQDAELIEIWRGPFRESLHRGHAVICDGTGAIVEAWGDPQAVILPRSSAKMIQALPLVESGAADAFALGTERLALACASHIGASYHITRVQDWIAELGLTDDAFRCGPQTPNDRETRKSLICSDTRPCQYHNNCSGKHSGFLTLARHLKAGPEYVDPDHPVQRAVRSAFEEVTGEASPGFGIDGCSAPNFATTVHGLARAMAGFATAAGKGGARAAAQARLTEAMARHPELVAGERETCTELMRALPPGSAVKGGADGVYVAILPTLGLGVALKISDGAERGKDAAMAALLIRLGLLGRDDPAAKRRVFTETRNWRGIVTGTIRPAPGLLAG